MAFQGATSKIYIHTCPHTYSCVVTSRTFVLNIVEGAENLTKADILFIFMPVLLKGEKTIVKLIKKIHICLGQKLIVRKTE